MSGNEKLILTKKDLCEGLRICARTLQSYVSDPRMNFPKPLRGMQKKVWSKASVAAWIAAGGAPAPDRGRPRGTKLSGEHHETR